MPKQSPTLIVSIVSALVFATAAQADEPAPRTGSIEVVASHYSGRRKDGDFGWMIKQDQYKQTLFIFNDDKSQFEDFTSTVAEIRSRGCSPGGGNAVVRPFRCMLPPRAAGIPTGPGFHELSPEVKRSIDSAFVEIRQIIANNHYHRIIYAAERNGQGFGTSIFQVSPAVVEYINDELRRLKEIRF